MTAALFWVIMQRVSGNFLPRNNHYSLRNGPEERSSKLFRGRRRKSRKEGAGYKRVKTGLITIRCLVRQHVFAPSITADSL